MTAAEKALERAVAPLDGVRAALLRALLAVPPVGRLLTTRDRRVALWATVHALGALALTVCFPMLLFVLGPVLLGVAHVAADVRYLVLRRGLPSFWKNAVWIGCAVLVGLRIAEELGFRGSLAMRVELLSAVLWTLLALGAGALAAKSSRRAIAALPVVAALGVACWLWPAGVRLVFVHLHNVFAIVLWLALFRSRPRAAWIPLIVIAGATLWLLGAPLGPSEATGGIYAFKLHLFAASDWLAPGLPHQLAIGLTLTYVFLQSVHYSAWLVLIPQEDVRAQGTLTFKMSARSLLGDFGLAGVAAISIAALAVLAGALFDVHRSRALYLSLAMFHGYLEVALLAFFWARGVRPASERACSSSIGVQGRN
jgi:hypothetical protein